MKQLQSILFLLTIVTILFSKTTFAITYTVSDATSGSTYPHGLWTSQDIQTGSGSPYFSIDGLLNIDDSAANSNNWTATLVAKATNPQGLEADINLAFNNWTTDYNYKQEGGLPYNPANVDFFTSVLGTITIDNNIYDIDGFASGFGFQYGLGANAKNPNAFGASAWIQSCQNGVNGACMNSHHWDLNLNLAPAPVPIPGAVYLFVSGLFGLGIFKRKNQTATA
ncbi:MAG: hypothetical protein K0U68_12985 [Gammaproteobacteria bacterium]|nr:hypothetical protein [Gammaproteobacteria bacterium]